MYKNWLIKIISSLINDKYLRAIARSLEIAGEPGGLLGDIIPDIFGSN